MARYEAGAGGVRLHFAGGASADADVLVGADGVHSAVRRQYLPDAEPADTGARCIYGKTLLRDLATLPSFVAQGFTAVVGGRIGMAVGPVRFREPPEAFGLSPAYDYLMWAVAGDRRAFGVPDEQLTTMDPAGLHALSAELIRTWHPGLRALHAQADIGETFAVRVRVSPPAPPWPPSRVTVLGDAIHAMSPAGGSGANTALRDAALLSRTLTAAPRCRPCASRRSATTNGRCASTATPPSPPPVGPKPRPAPAATACCSRSTAAARGCRAPQCRPGRHPYPRWV